MLSSGTVHLKNISVKEKAGTVSKPNDVGIGPPSEHPLINMRASSIVATKNQFIGSPPFFSYVNPRNRS